MNGMICITGTTGFIGSNLLAHLAGKGKRVKVLLRPGAVLRSEHDQALVIRGDIRDPGAAKELLKGSDCLIHLANVYRHQVSTIEEMRAINVEATLALFEEAVEQGVRRIVYISSAGVHRHTGEMVDESVPLNTETGDPYEKHKIACEKHLRELSRQSGTETVVLRPATVYGPGDKRLAPLFNMIRSGKFFFIGGGDNYVSWIFIQDLVEVIEAGVERPEASGKAYLVTGSDVLTLRELASLIAEIQGKEAPTLSLPVFPFTIGAAICEKLCPVLGVQPPIHRARLRFFTDSLRYSSKKIKSELGALLDTPLQKGLRITIQGMKG
ncbi:MAG: NAD-dependent epimerase/dehydratase family protein [Desulfobacteraceae bacterium]|nr:MAG: NAD-dependent epimerase/dehydratase family protein [Desulfobacteraceae bacterium]